MNAGEIIANLKLKTDEFRAGVNDAQQQIGNFSQKINNVSGDFKAIGAAGVAFGTATAAGIGSAVKTAANFESSMSRVGALSGATKKEMAMMTDEAKRLGSTTSFSASQAAEGYQALSMAGFSAKDSTAALGDVLNMAAAGQIELGTAANIASNIMSGFGIEAKNASNVSDVLAKTFTSSNTTLEGLGMTMKYVAPVASSVGWELEDMAGAAGKLGDAGIDSSQAGTMLRGAISKLAKPSKEASEIMKEYGINIKKADGTMKSLPAILESMNSGFSELDDVQKANAMSTLFGQEAMSGMMALMKDPQGLREYTAELKDAGGTAQRIADEQLDNLQGSLVKLGSAFEGAKIAIGTVFIPVLTFLVDMLTKVLSWFNQLPQGVQTTIAVFTALATVGSLVGGALLLVIGFLPSIIAGFGSLAVVGSTLMTALGAIGSALAFLVSPVGLVIAGLTALAAGVVYLVNRFNLMNTVFATVQSGVTALKSYLTGLANSFGLTGSASNMLKQAMSMLRNLFVEIGAKAMTLWNQFRQTEVFAVLSNMVQQVITKFREFGDAIMTAINSGDFTPLLEKVAGLIPMLIGLIMGGVPALLIAGMKILSSVADGMGISVPELLAKISQVVVQMIQKFAQMLPQMLQTGVQLLTTLIQGIVSALPQILNAVLQVITTLVNTVVQLLPTVLSAGIKILMAIIDGILQLLPQLISTVATIITQFVQAVVTYLPAILSAGIDILLALVDGILQMLPQLITVAIQLITTILNALITALPQIITAGIEIVMTLVDGILQMLPQLINAAIELIVSIVNALVGALPQIIQAGVEILLALVDGIIQMLPTLIQAALTLILELATALLGALPQIINAGIEILLALIDGIIQMLPQLINAALELIFAIVDALIGALPQIIDAGVQILMALIDGLIQTIPSLVGAIPQIVSAIFDAFGQVDWASIGTEIINGIKSGITNMAGSLASSAIDAASGALNGMKDFLGIASPSKVTRDQVGGELMNGITVGIKKLKKKPMSAMTSVAKNIVNGTDVVKDSMQSIAGMHVNPSIGNVRPNVAGVGGFNSNGGNDDTGNGGVNVNIEHMETRDDEDVRNVSRELYNLQRNRDRSKGGR